MQFRDKKKHRIIINITSLVDVLFLLLIFFIVSSTFLEQPGMKLDLPKTALRELNRVEDYTLFITSEETMYLNDEKVELDDLAGRFKTIAPEIEEQGLVLKADETVPYGLVVKVMDLAKQNNIHKLIVATQPKESSGN